MSNVPFVQKLMRSKGTSLAAITIVLIIFFGITNKNFLSSDSIRGMLISCSLSGTVTVGMACLLMSGCIDLSVGSNAALSAMLFVYMLRAGLPLWLSIIITLICGAVCGLINAFLCNVMGFVPFIATIGTQSVFRALAQFVADGNILALPSQTLGFSEFCTSSVGIFPVLFIIMVVLMVIYGFIIGRTKFGRRLMLCGGNRRSARLAGINHKAITTIMFANCGAIAALAGMTVVGRMQSANPTGLSGIEMDGMTAAMLGGVSFFGGGSSGMGVVLIGLLLLQIFQSGLIMIGLSVNWQVIIKGALLIMALAIEYFREEKRIKNMKRAAEAA